jgi:signal transduction histidine kinase
MLEGFDRDWTEPLDSRVANYTNLPPGEYRFRVQAFEMNMPDKTTQAWLGIDWRPHVYRTGWFLALCATLTLAAVWSAYRFRLSQVHDRFEAVLEERNRIAREIHDTVIQGCASTSALLEAVVSLDLDESGPGRALLDSARDQVRETINEARRAVWDLRQKGTTPPGLCPLLDQMTKQMSQVSHVSVEFEASGRPVALDDTVAHVVLMVAREAVSNAVRHAQPQAVRVGVHFAAGSVRLRVVDDGRGFDSEEAFTTRPGHFGLVGMRERVEGVGGRFEVKTSPGDGTALLMEVPVRPVSTGKHPVGAKT